MRFVLVVYNSYKHTYMHTYIQKLKLYRKNEINIIKTWNFGNLLYIFYYRNNQESQFSNILGEFFTAVMKSLKFCIF